MIVSYNQRRRDENAAATLLIGDLTIFAGAAASVINSQTDSNTDAGKVKIANRLVRLRPKISPLFDASMVRVIYVDSKLCSHLRAVKMSYDNIFQILDRLQEQFKIEDFSTLFENQFVLADAKKIYQGLESAINHAECAGYLLKYLILTRYSCFNRIILPIKRQFFPSELDKKSEQLFKDMS